MGSRNVGWSSILVLLFVILNFTHSVSQTPNPKIGIISQIDSLNTLAAYNLNRNLKAAFQSATEAKRLALTSGEAKQIIRSICLESLVKARINQSADALSNLSLAETEFSAVMDANSRAEIFSARGLIYYLLSKFDSSKSCYEYAIQQFKSNRNELQSAFELNRLARVYLRSGESKNAIAVSETSSRIFDEKVDTEGKALSLDLKGEIYSAQRLYDKALASHQAGLIIFKSIQHLTGISISEVHIGNVWYMKAIDDSALFYYNSALMNYRALGDSNGIAICYTNLSRVFLEKNDFKKSINYANLTLSTIKGGEYKLIESTTYQQLCDIYAALGEYLKAVFFLKQSLILATSINHKVTIMDCRKSLSEVYYTIHSTDSAYANLLEAYHYKDTLQPLVYSKQLAELQNKYEVEKQQVVLNSLQQKDKIKSLEIHDQQNQIGRRNTIIISGLIIVLLLGFVIYLVYQQQKLAQDLERAIVVKDTKEQERIRFARDLHDEVGSGLSKISFLSGVLVSTNVVSEANSEKALAINETSKELVDSMRDLIWTLNQENTTLENLVVRIREFTSDYLEEFPIVVQFDFPEQIPDIIISKQSHREIFMSIKECLNNIVKHSGAKLVAMKLEVGNDLLFVRITDNGIGISGDNDAIGNGIRNMTNRITGIDGMFSLRNDVPNGVVVEIKIPLIKLRVS